MTVRSTTELLNIFRDGQGKGTINELDLRDLVDTLDVVRTQVINVKDAPYNAKGDGKRLTDGSINAGTSTFNSPSANFQPSDAGKLISITGAGAGGSPLVTNIANRLDANNVALNTNAINTVAAQITSYASDDTIPLALAWATGRSIYHPYGVYGNTAELNPHGVQQRIFGEGRGGYYTNANPKQGVLLKWFGAVDGKMIRVPTGFHGFQCGQIGFDLNDVAKAAIHLDAKSGEAIQLPFFDNLFFQGYRGASVIFGDENTAALANGQIQTAIMLGCVWGGGGGTATPANVMAILMNAQNLEKLLLLAPYMDPFTAIGGGPFSNHQNHIAVKSGGLHIVGWASTRSTSYAVQVLAGGECGLNLEDWRSEDIFLVQGQAGLIGNPWSIRGVQGRSGLSVGTELGMDIVGGGPESIVLDDIRMPNNMTIHGNVDCNISATNIKFVDNIPKAVGSVDTATDIITINAHGFPLSQRVRFTANGGTLPGLVDGSTYYIIAPTTNTFKLANTQGGAAIDLTAFTGAPTIVASPEILVSGAGPAKMRIAATPGEEKIYNSNAKLTLLDNSNSTMFVNDRGHLRVQSVDALSSGVVCNNFRGTVVVTGVATQINVVFLTAESDASYRVTSLEPQTQTGTPAVGSGRKLTNLVRTTAGFTIDVEVAPGVGNSVTWFWEIGR